MTNHSVPSSDAASGVPGMAIRGSQLSEEETAAVVALVGVLAASQEPAEDDREAQRFRRFSQRRRMSTWNREEAAHWRNRAGKD